MQFDTAYALETVPIILQAAGTTIGVAVASCFGAALLGFAWEILRRSGRIMSYVMRFVIDCIRSTPVLAQIYFIYFVLPYYGIRLPALLVGILCLSFYYSGYLAEVFRAGIDMIHHGQMEAAKALGLSRRHTIAFIIAPQMLRNIAAPLGNYFVSILKATPYLAVIAVPEMLGSALDIAAETFRYAEPLFVSAVIFLGLAFVISQLVAQMERRLMASHRR
ncbi:amino acid ABC transporter permease [Aquamicrobium sp. LC103]|uniref:amino acid ABC transporter permease n=1 Tax=Aquamicrobium sp. LC103 TaxID=1120658 RepID=UPI00063ED1BB|nr:amino acid ABC transporter permease [Aquamicrobium sp. LC103]TKT78325.1 amino acid ABC transporter permease [Aquamicrobium sp. LC103]